jgi:hypothetical protein
VKEKEVGEEYARSMELDLGRATSVGLRDNPLLCRAG